jgi:hypothetical protein
VRLLLQHQHLGADGGGGGLKGGTEVFWEIVAVTSAFPFFSGVVPVTLALIGMTCGVPWHTMRLPLGGTPVLPLARTSSGCDERVQEPQLRVCDEQR